MISISNQTAKKLIDLLDKVRVSDDRSIKSSNDKREASKIKRYLTDRIRIVAEK